VLEGATVEANVARRRELAEFLRARRSRIDPGEAGIAVTSRRRAPGLRREEVAQLSGMSVTWYTWLEQAREITASPQVLRGLARALRLTEAEQRHLFNLAGQQPPPSRSGAEPSPALRRLVDVLDPHPAYLLAPCWELLAWNKAEAGLIGDPMRFPPAERNIVWLVFTDPAMRDLIVGWPRLARGMLAQYRADAGRHPGDRRFERLTAALREASGEFREWWDEHDVASFMTSRWQFNHPRLGRLDLDYAKLAALDLPAVRLFTCMPADAATEAKLPALTR
jgi:transcriptional regulator with XRE-family HTH domain